MRDRARSASLATWSGLVVALILGSCSMSASDGASLPAASASAAVSAEAPGLRYVALGDSYTIGTAVAEAERFPNQLVAALGPGEPTLRLVANLATNGFTSRDLIDIELPALDTFDPEFVTVCIGVNDVVQRVPLETYQANVTTILDALLGRLSPERIVVVAIPDYTVTPQGASYGEPAVAQAGIQANNAAMATLAGARGIAFVDIYDISLGAQDDETLVADDGLHPSSAQYARWIQRLLPVVEVSIGR